MSFKKIFTVKFRNRKTKPKLKNQKRKRTHLKNPPFGISFKNPKVLSQFLVLYENPKQKTESYYSRNTYLFGKRKFLVSISNQLLINYS